MSFYLGAPRASLLQSCQWPASENTTHPNVMYHLWWRVKSWRRKRQGPIEQLHVLSVAINNASPGTAPAFWGILHPDSTPAYMTAVSAGATDTLQVGHEWSRLQAQVEHLLLSLWVPYGTDFCLSDDSTGAVQRI